MKKSKYTNEILQQICKENDLMFVETCCRKDNKNKSRRYIGFQCNKHKQFGLQYLTVEKFISNHIKCGYCNHRKLKENFSDVIKSINPNIIPLEEYKTCETKMHFKCLIDGTIWQTEPRVIMYNRSGCPVCGINNRAEKFKKSIDDITEQLYTINPNIKIIGEYTGYHDYIRCKCKIDDCEWESIVANLLNGSVGCPECHKREIIAIKKIPQDTFITRVKQVNPNIEILDNYINSNTPVKCKCLIHRNTFYTSPRTFLSKDKGGIGCPFCIQSKGERLLIQILEKFKNNFKVQYTIDGCKNVNKLRFDAYDIDNNIAFEYQGEQHYYPVDFAGKGQEWAAKEHEIILQRDSIKRNYCQKHNIQLIEIPYWERDNMEQYIMNKLKGIK